MELTLPITTVTGNGDSNGDSNGYSNGDSNALLIVKDKISKGLKVSYKESSQAIVELCKDWRSAQEIALALGYSAAHVKNKLIPRMISDGLIEQYDKRSVTSPEPKYRTKQDM